MTRLLRSVEIPHGALWIHTIYNRPRDYPDCIVVRVHVAVGGGASFPTTIVSFYDHVDDARAALMRKGLTPISRWAHDDPNILETWL
jgi:hypothetical protein